MNRRTFLCLPLAAAAAQTSRIVYPGEDGRLVYAADELGNRIPDFSNCGYMGGGVSLPDVPVAAEVAPGEGDRTEAIQAVLDDVAVRAGESRGAVLLKRGRYRIEGALRIAAGGIVLRGEGSGEDGSVLVAAGTQQRTLVEIRGRGPGRVTGSARRILDDYVPVGANSFRVASITGLTAGDRVVVRRVGNTAWISHIGMDRIALRPDDPASTVQWAPFNLDFQRIITAIDGDRVTVDAPITCAIETQWGGGSLYTFDGSERISQCGIEYLRGESEFDPGVTATYNRQRYFADERHAWTMISLDSAADCWVRGVAAFYFGFACVDVQRTRSVTLEDCECRDMVSQITGSRRYPYNLAGQLTLAQRCQGDTGRHDFAVSSRVCGPNVFLDCTAGTSYATSEPHHRWSVGGLYDNVKANIAVQDRQYYGTGHGWAGANYVLWNCEGELVCQKPPAAQNWAIGHVGPKVKGAFEPREDGYWESHGEHVEPRSLYLQQLRDRLG